jgi:hypothetical protein
MNRLLVVASLVCATLAAAACGSDSTAPKDVFSGTWAGNLAGVTQLTLTTTQNGSAVTGTGTAVNTNTFTLVVTGTSTPPSLNLAITASDSEHLTFDGSYVTADSVAGMIHEGSDSVALSLKKQ